MPFFRLIACAGALLAASLSPAAAETLAGDYVFRSFDQKDGMPLCVEHWHFGNSGILTVRSGEEILHRHFTLESDAEGSRILMANIDTNGQPDCWGKSTAEVSEGEYRISWFASNDGTVNLCPAPPEGQPIYVGACFAYLRPENE